MDANLETRNNYSKIYFALSRRRFADLLQFSEQKDELIRVLPCLCRTALYPGELDEVLSDDDRNKLRALLLEFSHTNTLVTFMSVDCAILETDLRNELKLLEKNLRVSSTNGNLDSYFSTPSIAGVGQRFENGDPTLKFRLLLSEILTTRFFLNEFKKKNQSSTTSAAASSKSSRGAGTSSGNAGGGGASLRKFEPLDNKAYVGDCCDLLIIFLAERSKMISVEDLCETLICYRNGPDIVRAIVLNFPDTWSKVCHRLIDNADAGKNDRSLITQKRMEALNLLCALDQFGAADLVNYCVEKGKFRLLVFLAVRYLPSESIVSLFAGTLASVDEKQRSTLVSYVQTAQKEWPILLEVNIPKTTKRSTAPKVDNLRTATNVQDRSQYTEMDEAMYDIIGRDSNLVVDLKSVRELWEQGDNVYDSTDATTGRGGISVDDLGIALRDAVCRPSAAISALRRILRSRRGVQTVYIDALTESLPVLLEANVPLYVIQLASRLWSKIELLSPRKLYVLTTASLLPGSPSRITRTPWRQRTSHLELCKDPLTILRCDERVFRCAPILALLLRVLRCYLAASRAYLQREFTLATSTVNVGTRRSAAGATPIVNQQTVDAEREELMRSLVGAQESAAVQILLEACLPFQSEVGETSNLTSLREIRCIICSFIHQMFISDPILSKLVHFQTYPSELLPVTVAGIPSIHICLDFIPELLSQPIQSKRVFGVDLLSHLCEHYAIPKAFSIARLAINVLSTLIGVISGEEVVAVFSGLLPALLRINRVFPPLSADISSLLAQVGRICRARLAANEGAVSSFIGAQSWPNLRIVQASGGREAVLLTEINDTFRTTFADSALTYPL